MNLNRKGEVEKHSDQTKTGHNIRFPSKWWKNSWLIIGLLFVVVLIASLMAAGTFVSDADEKDKPKTEQEIRFERIEEVNSLLSKGKYEEAEKVVVDAINKNDNQMPAVLAELHLIKSSIFAAQGDFETAMSTAIEANNISTSYDTVATIAGYAYVLGDEEALKQYLPLQLEKLNPSDPLYEQTKADLEARIEELGG